VQINGYDGKYVQLIYWVRNRENKTTVDDYSKHWIINKKSTSNDPMFNGYH
jgi:hypothetical protein